MLYSYARNSAPVAGNVLQIKEYSAINCIYVVTGGEKLPENCWSETIVKCEDPLL